MKHIYLAILVFAAVFLGSCGGSSGGNSGGPAQGRFTATLADGGVMEIEVNNSEVPGDFTADFNAGHPNGTDVESGICEGTVNGSNVTAACQDYAGNEFALTGRHGSGGYHFVRSDMGTDPLNFAPALVAAPANRAEITFIVRTSSVPIYWYRVEQLSGPMTIPNSPTYQNAFYKEYAGTYGGSPAYVITRGSRMEVFLKLGPAVMVSLLFNNLSVNDLGKSIVNSDVTSAVMLGEGNIFTHLIPETCRVEPVP